ncbi:hypothetical protein CVT25_013009 [Psilocybe cyanescens]|uniref:Uncharacterized protein n=1 Tax=Psilocybe cyanescens TaxID=93625 RepID=A0A409XWR2_PSICY|nr:hypothetical protein CVT25_013009 [Psilocybe cyanescens]
MSHHMESVVFASSTPYDQWFPTYIDPTWKIRHLQIIVTKCLILPLDPLKVAHKATVRKNTSAGGGILLAKETVEAGSSSGAGAVVTTSAGASADTPADTAAANKEVAVEGVPSEGGYEDDDEWGKDVEDDDGMLAKPMGEREEQKISAQQTLRIPPWLMSTSLPQDNPTAYPAVLGGQDLRPPHRMALQAPAHLTGCVVSGVIAGSGSLSIPGGAAAASASRGRFGGGSGGVRGVSLIAGTGAGVTSPALIPGPRRQDYSDYALGMLDFSSSMVGGVGVWVSDPAVPLFSGSSSGSVTWSNAGGRVKTKFECGGGWVVTRDGVVNLCKTRDDPTKTHLLPLLSFLLLRDSSHLAHSSTKANEAHDEAHQHHGTACRRRKIGVSMTAETTILACNDAAPPEVNQVLPDLPILGDLVRNLYECHYDKFFIALATLEQTHLLPSRTHLTHARTYAQLLEWYESLTLESLSAAFGVSVGFVDVCVTFLFSFSVAIADSALSPSLLLLFPPASYLHLCPCRVRFVPTHPQRSIPFHIPLSARMQDRQGARPRAQHAPVAQERAVRGAREARQRAAQGRAAAEQGFVLGGGGRIVGGGLGEWVFRKEEGGV